jgi:hypothetical protein
MNQSKAAFKAIGTLYQTENSYNVLTTKKQLKVIGTCGYVLYDSQCKHGLFL